MGNRPQIYGIYPIYGCVDLKIYEEDIRCVTLWCNACFREVWGYIMDLENNQKVIRSHPIHQTQYTRRLWYVMMWDWGWGLISPNQSRENLARIQRLFRFGGHIGEPGLVGLQNLSAQNWSLLIFTLWSLVNEHFANWKITIFKFGKSTISMGHVQQPDAPWCWNIYLHNWAIKLG